MLTQALIFLTVAVVAIPIFQRLGLGSVLGYLAAGAAVGPSGLALIADPQETLAIGEFGVVFMLFVIGLELQPSRLWQLRVPVFGFGGLQVLLTGGLIALLGHFAFALPWNEAIMVGGALALSSTALGLKLLTDRNERATPHGRLSFGILLFQDMAAIPLIAFAPLLGDGREAGPHLNGLLIAGVLVGMVVAGRFLVRPAFRFVQMARSHEVSTAATLLLVIGTAQLMHVLGLSMALGAFMAGVLLAESEYRHELEANVEPFRGLFLGLFFVAVGMIADFSRVADHPDVIGALVVGLLLLKFVVLFAVGRLNGLSSAAAVSLGVTLGQGGEFAFVAFGTATVVGAISAEVAAVLIVVISLSMMATPIIFFVRDAVLRRLRHARPDSPRYDELHDSSNTVIIAGFGRFGQIVGRVLRTRHIAFTALDANPEHVEFLRRFGTRVSYGDASRVDILRAAGAEEAQLLVLAIQDVTVSLSVVDAAKRHFPHIKIIARAHDRRHAVALKRAGVLFVVRDTLHSSLEAASAALEKMGLPEREARKTIKAFLEYDEARLEEAVTLDDNPENQRNRAQQYTAELERLFEGDVAEH